MAKMSGWMLKTESGKRLKRLLLEHAAFTVRPKMADEAVKLLAYLARLTRNHVDGRGQGLSYHDLRNRFRGGKGAPKACKKALFELGLLEVTAKPIQGTIFNEGRNTRYRVADKVMKAYQKAVREEWSVLGYDGSLCKGTKVELRRRRRLISLKLKDPFCRAHERLCCSVEVGWHWTNDADFMRDNPGAVDTAFEILGQLSRVDFDPIRRGKKSSRLFHPLVNFPSSLRGQLYTKELIYAGEVDIRACWPTFLSAQLLELNKDADEALRAECAKWQAAFCDDKIDPRTIVLKETALAITPKEMKECLNKYLNGAVQAAEKKDRTISARYKGVDEWFSCAYPGMHRAWKAAGPDTLGEKIGRNFETPLMADGRLYDYADSKGVMICYQYDGFGVFAQPGRQEALVEVLAGLCRLMRDISKEKFGVPIVVR